MENKLTHSNNAKKNEFIKMIPFILTLILLILYVALFTTSYLVPLLLPNTFGSLFYASPIKGSYLLPKIVIFCSAFPLFLLSYILTAITKGKEIPDDSLWMIQSLQDNQANPQLQIEALAIEIANRKDALLKNFNRIYSVKKSNQSTHSLLNSTVSSINTLSTSMAVDCISNEDYYVINERTEKNEIRYCGTCHKFRPDRSHHCKQCNTCYLKMDHHCFWLNNCITMTNYKYFILTIFYSSGLFLLFTWCLFDLIKHEYVNKSTTSVKLCALLVFLVITLIFFFLLSLLLLYHFNLILSNFTTFEHAQIEKDYELKKPDKKTSYRKIDGLIKTKMTEMAVSMFDMGKWNNFTQVFGQNPLLWCLPIRCDSYSKGYGHGLSFETNNKKHVIEEIKSI